VPRRGGAVFLSNEGEWAHSFLQPKGDSVRRCWRDVRVAGDGMRVKESVGGSAVAAASTAYGDAGEYGGGGQEGDGYFGHEFERKRFECGHKRFREKWESQAKERYGSSAASKLYRGGECFVVWRAV
jgi:hypothetical protein